VKTKSNSRIIFGIALFLVFGIICWLVGELLFYQGLWGSNLEAELGFRTATPFVNGNEYLQLVNVELDGPLYREGFRTGDYVMDLDLRQFYKILKSSKVGTPIAIKVSSVPPGDELEGQMTRIISLAIE
jgi:hypothetical protein